ncbi:MAG: hypothetical protein GXO47_01020 [Chlorobi bacterium]|nr:hypothetical protein [Chlorobiota bacterium]
MRNTDRHIEKRIDEILKFSENVPRVSPPPSFASNVMKRFEEEVYGGRTVTMNFMPYIRIAAAMIVFAVIGNLLILITSIKQVNTDREIYTAYTSEYNIDREDQWWINLTSGDYDVEESNYR